MDKPLRKDGEAIRTLQHLRNNLVGEIATRGDKRITDPVAMADAFFSEIARDRHTIAAGSDLSPAIQFLVDAGLDPDDIDPTSTFAETMDLMVFHKRLRIVAEANGLPLQELKRTVKQNRLPVTVIQESMRRHAHDQPERKGSELNDVHLLCLAPYADITYVDKRTLESVRRARGKDVIFDKLIGHVDKAGCYDDISTTLTSL